jgi:arylsulfatase A-like enzyme
MIVRWPGRAPEGRVSDVAWYFADFLPTAAELAGSRPPRRIDGVSVVPALLGRRQAWRERTLYWEHHGGGFQQAVRKGRWKAIRRGLSGPLELFDLDKDAGERRDVAARNPEVVRRIERYLATARTDSASWPVDR